MTIWLVWFCLAAAALILEMFTGSFYLLMISLGFAAGGLAALSGAGTAAQCVTAAIVGVMSTCALMIRRRGKDSRSRAGRNPDLNLDIGQSLVVDQWNDDARTARVSYRGALWDIEIEPGSVARQGEYVIREVRGSRLIVAERSQQKQI